MCNHPHKIRNIMADNESHILGLFYLIVEFVAAFVRRCPVIKRDMFLLDVIGIDWKMRREVTLNYSTVYCIYPQALLSVTNGHKVTEDVLQQG